MSEDETIAVYKDFTFVFDKEPEAAAIVYHLLFDLLSGDDPYKKIDVLSGKDSSPFNDKVHDQAVMMFQRLLKQMRSALRETYGKERKFKLMNRKYVRRTRRIIKYGQCASKRLRK